MFKMICTAALIAASPAIADELTQSEVSAVQDGVRYVLMDPEAARFRGMSVGENENGFTVVCGWVNTKNAYGAYVGERPYIGVLESEVFFLSKVAQGATEARAVLKYCAIYDAAL